MEQDKITPESIKDELEFAADVAKEDLLEAAEVVEEAADEVKEDVTGKGIRSAPVSHKLYDRMGLSMSLKAINGFIIAIVALLVIAVVVGILL